MLVLLKGEIFKYAVRMASDGIMYLYLSGFTAIG
jgi:hypothetical protein